MEYAVISLTRSLDLAKNYQPVKVGHLQVGLQTIKGDVAEIEIQAPDGMKYLKVPVAAAATVEGYTFINRYVDVNVKDEKRRRGIFGRGKDKTPEDGIMEAVFDVRWGDQSLEVSQPERDKVYDFMLVRQYDIVNDRPLVYNHQDVLQFGKLRLRIGERIEEGTRAYKKPRHAMLVGKIGNGDEEEWQVKLDGDYERWEDFRVIVTSYDLYNGWYQAYGISLVEGKPKEIIDETPQVVASGIAVDAHVSGDVQISQTRLDQAKADPHEVIIKVGESKNHGPVGVKLLKMRPGEVQVMFLSPKVKTVTLRHGQIFDLGRFDVSLVGVHGDMAILRIVPEE